MNKGKHILVVPLNWGLGHATRMMPLIDTLLAVGHQVSIGGDGRSGLLLKEAYPQLSYHEFPSYQVVYPEGDQFIFKTLSRLPIYLNAIRKEHTDLKKLIQSEKIDIVISDNRYGLYNSSVKSIFVGHQLGIILPKVFSPFRKSLYNTHLFFLKKFDQIWIPDFEGDNNISGKLTHQFKLPKKAKFIGPLSRFQDFHVDNQRETSIPILVILSGPEPQRSIFQKIIVHQAKQENIQLTIVEGKTEHDYEKTEDGIRFISFANKHRLFSLLKVSELVICRSGYSSIMDLSILGKKALFVPTPGQTEQEYLAKRLKDQKIAFYQNQAHFNLKVALEQTVEYNGFTMDKHSRDQLGLAIRAL